MTQIYRSRCRWGRCRSIWFWGRYWRRAVWLMSWLGSLMRIRCWFSNGRGRQGSFRRVLLRRSTNPLIRLILILLLNFDHLEEKRRYLLFCYYSFDLFYVITNVCFDISATKFKGIENICVYRSLNFIFLIASKNHIFLYIFTFFHFSDRSIKAS